MMAEDFRRPPPPTQRPRRPQSSPSHEEVVAVPREHGPEPPPTRAEFRSLERRIAEVERLVDEQKSEWKADLKSTMAAIEQHVSRVVAPLHDDMAEVLRLQRDAQTWRGTVDTIVRKVEIDDAAEKLAAEKLAADDARIQRKLAMHQGAADIAAKDAGHIDPRINGTAQRRVAIWVAIITLGGSLFAACIAAVASYYRAPSAQQGKP